MQHVLPVSGRVDRVGQEAIVITDIQRAERQKRVAHRKLIQIQQELFRGTLRLAPAEMERILLALVRAGEIEIAAQAVGNREVGLLNPAKHFLIELFLKLLGRPQDRVRVSVFGFQVGDDIGIFFLAEPSVVVDAAIAMQSVLHGFAPRYRRLGDGVCCRVVRRGCRLCFGVRIHLFL